MSLISLQGSSYRQLTPTGTRCGKKGAPIDPDTDQPEWPRRCYNNDVITSSDCEIDCDKYSWCIAYSHLKSLTRCFLFNSEETGPCPIGYIEENGPTMTSIEQITTVDSTHKDSACYVKLIGEK